MLINRYNKFDDKEVIKWQVIIIIKDIRIIMRGAEAVYAAETLHIIPGESVRGLREAGGALQAEAPAGTVL